MTLKERCQQLEAQGYKRQQIADIVGYTRQRVVQILGPKEKGYFKPITENGCIYPNWRKWMNDNKISVPELTGMLGMEACENNWRQVKRWMRGTNYPLQFMSEKLMEITGLSFEDLFSKEGD